MRTLIFALLALAGCATEWKCPNAPKTVAKFSVGEHVAYSGKLTTVWNSKSNPPSFWIDRGDTGVVIDIFYNASAPYTYYEIKLDKAEHMFILRREEDFEAVVYPDGALKP